MNKIIIFPVLFLFFIIAVNAQNQDCKDENLSLYCGLVSYWSMDNNHTEGNVMKDSHGSYDGIISNIHKINTGKPGIHNECYFSSYKIKSDYFIRIPFTNESYDYFSVSLWVKHDDTHWHMPYLSRERERWEETGRNYIGFNHLNYLSTDIGGFNETNGCGYFIDSMEAGVLKYKENPWYHFVLTYDEGNIIFYANGVNVSKVFSVEENASGNLLLFGVEDYSRVSAISAWGGRMDYFDGWMDEVAFYDRVLSPDEVKMLSGSFYDNFDIPVIFSRYPEEGYHVFNNSINFSCDILDNGNNLINISLYSNIYGEFSVLKSKDISGGKEDIIFELNVSDVKDGNYEWAFVAFDSFGNSNVADYYMLKVRNDDIYSIDKIKAKEGSLVCIFEDFAVYLRNIINNCLEKIK